MNTLSHVTLSADSGIYWDFDAQCLVVEHGILTYVVYLSYDQRVMAGEALTPIVPDAAPSHDGRSHEPSPPDRAHCYLYPTAAAVIHASAWDEAFEKVMGRPNVTLFISEQHEANGGCRIGGTPEQMARLRSVLVHRGGSSGRPSVVVSGAGWDRISRVFCGRPS